MTTFHSTIFSRESSSELPALSPERRAISVARRSRRDQLQDRIGGVAGLVGEIYARPERLQQAARKNGDHDVRRLHTAVQIRHRPRLYGGEAKSAILIGFHATETLKARRGVPVRTIGPVPAGGIGLPNFEQRIGKRLSVSIQNSPSNRDQLAGNAAGLEMFARKEGDAQMKEGADGLRRGGRKRHRDCSTGVASRPRRTISKR